jgi:hypothetical protein
MTFFNKRTLSLVTFKNTFIFRTIYIYLPHSTGIFSFWDMILQEWKFGPKLFEATYYPHFTADRSYMTGLTILEDEHMTLS